MIAHSPLLEEAVRYGHSVKTRVDIYQGGGLVYPDVEVVAGQVKSDRTANTRWTATIELGLYPWELRTQLDVARSRFTVRRGVTSLGYEEMLPLGDYRVDSLSRSAAGRVAIAGSGKEAYVIDARFLRPRPPPYGQPTVQAMVNLIGEAMPSPTGVVPMNTYDKPVQATTPWDRDRMDALNQLATSIRAEVYVDSSGTWVIKDDPTLQLAAPVYTINAGDNGGLLMAESGGDSRDGVYNAVAVSGRSDVEGQPPVFGWAFDADPTSPTYWEGPFGKKPRFYSSDMMATDEQCAAVARAQLRAALTRNTTFAFTSAAVVFLEAGDVVRVVSADGRAGNYLLNTTTLDLSPAGTLAAETYAMREQLGGES
jgi:hypothetical protein